MAIKTNMASLAPRRQAFKKLVTLPSHGLGNPTAWPDGQLYIYPWDSEDDDFLLEAARKAGVRQNALFDLVSRLCDLNGGQIDDFVADESNIVLLVSRALSQDGTIRYTAICPFCNSRSVEQIKVPDELEKVSEKPKDYVGYDVVILPTCKDEVKIRPLRIKDERLILERPAEDRKKFSDSALRTMLRIVSINDTTAENLSELKKWLDALPPKDSRTLEEQARELSPHLNTALPHQCANMACQREFKHVLTFDQDFFR